MYKLNDTLTQVVIDKASSPDETYDSFVKALPKDDCRYAVFDFEYDQPDGGGKRSKILFVLWYARTRTRPRAPDAPTIGNGTKVISCSGS